MAVGTSAADLRVLRAVERRTESPLSITLAVALTLAASSKDRSA